MRVANAMMQADGDELDPTPQIPASRMIRANTVEARAAHPTASRAGQVANHGEEQQRGEREEQAEGLHGEYSLSAIGLGSASAAGPGELVGEVVTHPQVDQVAGHRFAVSVGTLFGR